MKHYTPIAAQEDLSLILAAVHQLQETIVVTPTDASDVQAAVIMPKREWDALRELAFLQDSEPRSLKPTPRRFGHVNTDHIEWG